MSTLYDTFLNKGTIQINSTVKLPIGKDATVYGFLACNDFLFSNTLDSPPLGIAHVIRNRIFCFLGDKTYRFPIFASISKPRDEKYPVYLLYVPRLLDLEYKSYVDAYRLTMKNERPHVWVQKVDGISVTDGVAYYYPKEDEYLFESQSKLKGIGNAFLVITRRVAPEHGGTIYEIFEPSEIELMN